MSPSMSTESCYEKKIPKKQRNISKERQTRITLMRRMRMERCVRIAEISIKQKSILEELQESSLSLDSESECGITMILEIMRWE